MNLAVGIPCPSCRHEVANLLEFLKDEFQVVTGHRLRCVRCETVYLEIRVSASQTEEMALESLLDDAIRRS